MPYPILERVDAKNHDDWLNRRDPSVDRSSELLFSLTSNLTITDLSNAFLSGKTCTRFVIEGCNSDPTSLIFKLGSLSAIFQHLLTQSWEQNRWGGYDSQKLEIAGLPMYVHRSDQKGARTFSPIHLERLKPLPHRPRKWTLKHVVRALANHQFEDLRTDMHLTDDYHYDSATNFGKGTIRNPLAFAKRLTSSPSGWRVSESEDRVRVSCHHFDYKSFRFIPEPSAELKSAA